MLYVSHLATHQHTFMFCPVSSQLVYGSHLNTGSKQHMQLHCVWVRLTVTWPRSIKNRNTCSNSNRSLLQAGPLICYNLLATEQRPSARSPGWLPHHYNCVLNQRAADNISHCRLPFGAGGCNCSGCGGVGASPALSCCLACPRQCQLIARQGPELATNSCCWSHLLPITSCTLAPSLSMPYCMVSWVIVASGRM